ncbi:hypothetical protein IAD21_00566 [Abditibacteriota bacterium]|nr:hypothetical protein IAD21_00566 [Abditibacteriota bacterium]
MSAPARLYHELRVQFFDHPLPPATAATALDLLSRSAWHGAGVQNVAGALFTPSRGDVRQFRFDNQRVVEEDIDLLDDDVSAGKIPALMPGYKLDCRDNYPYEWEDIPLPEEAALLASAKQETQRQITALEAKIAAIVAPAQPTDADKEALSGLYNELDGLRTDGFLESIPGSMLWGDDQTGVYRRLSTANVPFRRRSRFTLENRPFTLWLWRAKFRPGQQNIFFQVDIGARLRLLFDSNDRATLYRKNELRDKTEFEKKDAEWQKLRAKRDLAPNIVLKVMDERDKIAALRADAKGLKRKLTTQERATLKAEIKKHNKTIQELQGDKGQSGADKARLKDLEAYLFRDVVSLELSNTGDSLVDEPFALTMIDSGVGYVSFVLDIGSNSFTFEDRYLTSRGKEEWMWGAPGDKIELRSSGGACAWRFGYIAVNPQDQLRMAPTYLGTLGHDPALPVANRMILPPGTSVDFGLNSSTKLGWYQGALNFTSDGKRMPMVFRAVIQVPATPSPAPEMVWDSVNVPSAVLSGTPLMEEDRSGALWQIDIYGIEGIDNLSLPANIRRRIANVWIRSHDGSGGNHTEWRRVLTGGLVADDTLERAKRIPEPGVETSALDFGCVHLTIRDKGQRVADAHFYEELEHDGQWIGDAIYNIRRNMGATEDELSLLPRGSASGWKLSPTPPGERAAYKARQGTARLGYIQNELVERFGLGRQYYFDSNGRDCLEFPSSRAVTGVRYRPASSDTATGRRVYYEGEPGFTRSRTLDKYRTSFLIQGAVDPDSKKRREWRYEFPDAVDEEHKDSPYFVGEHIPLEPIVDDAYTTGADLEAVGRSQIAKWCRLPETWEVQVPYEDDVLPGAIFEFELADGTHTTWRVVRITPDDVISSDQLTVQLETP